MKKTILSLLILLMTVYLIAKQEKVYDFQDTEINSTITLKNYSGRVPARIEAGYINLMRGGWSKDTSNAAIFPDIINDKAETENYSFEMYITRGAEGAGFALISTQNIFDDSLSYYAESWERPNFKGSFGLGIDVYNPQSSHWFDEFGNFYGREEREISLHWDGKEVYKMMSPVEFRSDGMTEVLSKFDIRLKYVTAGALVNVAINDTTIIDSYFIPEMVQYPKQPVIGATTSHLTCNVIVSSFAYKTEGVKPSFSLIDTNQLLSDEIFHAGNRRPERYITFPKNTQKADKVILTIDLGGPEGGVADWDVTAAIYLIDSDSTKYELIRYITPYRRAFVWKTDITHFLPLFTGEKKIIGRVDTWDEVTEDPAEQRGWKVTATLDYYKGKAEYKPYEVHNLWSGSFEYGDPENPMKDMLQDFVIKVPKAAKKGVLRVTVTGHGMSPNTDNAGEFRPSDRTIIINEDSYENTLWKTDCYLNPCRPQDGTWKFDRTGWAPGDLVHPWVIDLTEYVQKNKEISFTYIPDDYVNEGKGEHWAPHHFIEAQVIFYK
ncbi:MAG: hypothetical protein FWG20_02020 [Candidatus Cloacimonetes bacterium]|nr:hypothetical protein [Candidatus Cloacimonadota bacterium]